MNFDRRGLAVECGRECLAYIMDTLEEVKVVLTSWVTVYNHTS